MLVNKKDIHDLKKIVNVFFYLSGSRCSPFRPTLFAGTAPSNFFRDLAKKMDIPLVLFPQKSRAPLRTTSYMTIYYSLQLILLLCIKIKKVISNSTSLSLLTAGIFAYVPVSYLY